MVEHLPQACRRCGQVLYGDDPEPLGYQRHHQQQQRLGAPHTFALMPLREGLQEVDPIGTGRRLGHGTRAVLTNQVETCPGQPLCVRLSIGPAPAADRHARPTDGRADSK